jgi:uncharacterized protein (DUF1810 family)
MTDADPFRLVRFVEAQDRLYPRILAELRDGVKRSHWMWFVFPQIAGLGSSPTSQRFAIGSIEEAGAYLAHPILGPRLRECTGLVQAVRGRSIEQILGEVDAVKFRSSMTLFAKVADDAAVFTAALDQYYGGEPDRRTLMLISG